MQPCPFIHNADKITGPKRSIKITNRFTCTSANVIYFITCTLCKKIYIGETGRRLGDRFLEHLRDVERNDKDASKPVARHFNLPNHSWRSAAFPYTRVGPRPRLNRTLVTKWHQLVVRKVKSQSGLVIAFVLLGNFSRWYRCV